MKTELDLLRGTVSPVELPENGRMPLQVLMACRKMINTSANEMIHDGVLMNNLPQLSRKLGELMVANCQVLLTLGQEPELEDFIFATSELTTLVRKTMDDSLARGRLEDVRISAVMVELLVKGAAYTLGLPFGDIMEEMVASMKEGREPNMEAVMARSDQ